MYLRLYSRTIRLITGDKFSSMASQPRSKKFKFTLAVVIALSSSWILASEAAQFERGSRPDIIPDRNISESEQPKEYVPFLFPYLRAANFLRVQNCFYTNDYENSTVKELIQDSVIFKAFTILQGDVSFHRYEDPKELKQSGGPEVDQELCLKQLGKLNERAQVMKEERLNSKDIELNRLLDTFGRVPSGLLSGHSSWLGSYDNCLDLKVRFKEGKSAMRYCSAAIKLNGWPEDEDLDKVAVLKMGVCLPKACDSQQYKNKLELVQQLAELNGRQLDIGTWNFTYLYCLPDEESDLRIWWKSPGAVVTAVIFFGWISMLVFATIQHHKLVSAGKRRGDTIRADDNESLTAIKSAAHKLEFVGSDSQVKSKFDDIYRALSIHENFQALVRTRNAASQSISVVDLSVLDGIKVFCMIYIIAGHAMISNLVVTDSIYELSKSSLLHPIITSAPAFAVNIFFAITGLLTAYSAFKNQSLSQIASMVSPPKWFAFVLNRYLRLMPIYMVIVLYAKYIAVYTGSGPLWDYATAPESFRRMCYGQSLLRTATLATNMFEIPETCISSGWYLCNDFQFAIVTPIFLACLARNETIGKWLIKICLVTSFTITVFAQYSSPAPDLRPLVQAAPHLVKSVFPFNVHVYFQPQYRIGPYLIGLLLGFGLHKYEKKKTEWLEGQSEKAKTLQNSPPLAPDWPNYFRRVFPTCCFTICALFAFVAPFLGPHSRLSKQEARVVASLAVPLSNNLYALLIGLYLLLATTGHGFKRLNGFLEYPLWKPMARLSLCALLTNMLVADTISGLSDQMRHFDALFQLMINVFTVVGVYSAAAVSFVLIESPLNRLTRHLLAPILSSRRGNQSAKQTLEQKPKNPPALQ